MATWHWSNGRYWCSRANSCTESEVKIAAEKIAIRKTPGLDGVLGLAIKTAALNVSYIFKETFNTCLSDGIFPAQWKIQRLVLLPKGNEPPDEPSSHRPLCILDIVGKLFEGIISVRLEVAIAYRADRMFV